MSHYCRRGRSRRGPSIVGIFDYIISITGRPNFREQWTEERVPTGPPSRLPVEYFNNRYIISIPAYCAQRAKGVNRRVRRHRHRRRRRLPENPSRRHGNIPSIILYHRLLLLPTIIFVF